MVVVSLLLDRQPDQVLQLEDPLLQMSILLLSFFVPGRDFFNHLLHRLNDLLLTHFFLQVLLELLVLLTDKLEGEFQVVVALLEDLVIFTQIVD